MRAAGIVSLADATIVTARGSIGWRHAFGDVIPEATLAFAAGGAPFTIAGVPIARDSAVIEAGLDYDIGRATKLGITYAGALAANAQDHAVKGNLLKRF